MFGRWLLSMLVALALTATLGACASNGVQPGLVSTSSGKTAASGTYGSAASGDAGRVVAINEVELAGASGGGGSGRGPLLGGILGAGSGAAIGAATSRSVVGGVVGGILGAVGGAILGTIIDTQGGATSGGRGIEVTVQKDDGQTVRIAQHDDGDIQLGDRVQVVQSRSGVAKVVRNNARTYDPNIQGGAPPQDYNNPPADYRQSRYSSQGPQGNVPQGYGQQSYGSGRSPGNYPQNYGSGSGSSAPAQNYGQSPYSPQPQDDPRYGDLN